MAMLLITAIGTGLIISLCISLILFVFGVIYKLLTAKKVTETDVSAMESQTYWEVRESYKNNEKVQVKTQTFDSFKAVAVYIVKHQFTECRMYFLFMWVVFSIVGLFV